MRKACIENGAWRMREWERRAKQEGVFPIAHLKGGRRDEWL